VSIDVIEADRVQVRAQPQVNASESLVRIPGITANNRYNYAQGPADPDAGGFGARWQFGVRGIRICQDGIPLSTPDGQGQDRRPSTCPRPSRSRSCAGRSVPSMATAPVRMVQIFTRDAPEQPDPQQQRLVRQLREHPPARTCSSACARAMSASPPTPAHAREPMATEENSSVRRETFDAKLAWQLAQRARLTWTVSGLDQPETLDPQGLTLSEYRSDRKAASPDALVYRTRVQRSQYQTGLVLDHQFENGDSLRALTYYGTREPAVPGRQRLQPAAGRQARSSASSPVPMCATRIATASPRCRCG
jgi:iron complex outermembrane receptor protein